MQQDHPCIPGENGTQQIDDQQNDGSPKYRQRLIRRISFRKCIKHCAEEQRAIQGTHKMPPVNDAGAGIGVQRIVSSGPAPECDACCQNKQEQFHPERPDDDNIVHLFYKRKYFLAKSFDQIQNDI